MSINMKQSHALLAWQMLEPAPHGHAMVVADVNVPLAIEEVYLLATGTASGRERDEPMA